MRKLMTAISFTVLALAGIGGGFSIAQTGIHSAAQVADVKYDFPTNAQEDDVHIRDIAELKYDFPTNAQEDDVHIRNIA
jgi:hypothetical protein